MNMARRPARTLQASVVLVTLLLGAGDARASRTRELGLADMAARAGRIFDGTCTGRVVVEPAGGARPYTTYTFEVVRAIKGVDGPVVTFSVPGTPDGRGFIGMPVFEIGERAVLLLYPPGPRGHASPMGLDQGLFRVLEAADGPIAIHAGARGRLLDDVPRDLRARALAPRHDGGMRLETLEAVLLALVAGGRP
jgi:hypothetical protein